MSDKMCSSGHAMGESAMNCDRCNAPAVEPMIEKVMDDKPVEEAVKVEEPVKVVEPVVEVKEEAPAIESV